MPVNALNLNEICRLEASTRFHKACAIRLDETTCKAKPIFIPIHEVKLGQTKREQKEFLIKVVGDKVIFDRLVPDLQQRPL